MELTHLYEHARKAWEIAKNNQDSVEQARRQRIDEAISEERGKAYTAIHILMAGLAEYADLSGNDFYREIDINLPDAAPITIRMQVTDGQYSVADWRDKGEETLFDCTYLVKIRVHSVDNFKRITWGYNYSSLLKDSFSREELFECIGYALEVYRQEMDRIVERMERDTVKPFDGDAVKYVSDLARKLGKGLEE
jgi:hypothetical protein